MCASIKNRVHRRQGRDEAYFRIKMNSNMKKFIWKEKINSLNIEITNTKNNVDIFYWFLLEEIFIWWALQSTHDAPQVRFTFNISGYLDSSKCIDFFFVKIFLHFFFFFYLFVWSKDMVVCSLRLFKIVTRCRYLKRSKMKEE